MSKKVEKSRRSEIDMRVFLENVKYKTQVTFPGDDDIVYTYMYLFFVYNYSPCVAYVYLFIYLFFLLRSEESGGIQTLNRVSTNICHMAGDNLFGRYRRGCNKCM